jgi:hypothetical protein
MAAKRMKLDQTAIKEILVADKNSESDAEASDLGDKFYESEEASAQEDEPQAATRGGGSPTSGPPQGRNIKIHPFVGLAKSLKNSEALHIKKYISPLVVLLFFTKVFSCWWNRQTYTTSNNWTDKPDLAADCLTLRCLT